MQKRRRRPCDTGPEHTVPSAHGTGRRAGHAGGGSPHRSFRPRHRHWLRGLLLAVLVLAVLFLLYGCAVQRLIYSSRGTMIFLPDRPLL